MTLDRMIELLQIEHECMLRGAHDDCDRKCAECLLVQDDDELHEMYTNVIALLGELDSHRWIPVVERLPDGDGKIYAEGLEESKPAIVYGKDYAGEKNYGIGTYIIDYDSPESSGWNGCMLGDYDLDDCVVTHWTPLPEPPVKGR